MFRVSPKGHVKPNHEPKGLHNTKEYSMLFFLNQKIRDGENNRGAGRPLPMSSAETQDESTRAAQTQFGHYECCPLLQV